MGFLNSQNIVERGPHQSYGTTCVPRQTKADIDQRMYSEIEEVFKITDERLEHRRKDPFGEQHAAVYFVQVPQLQGIGRAEIPTEPETGSENDKSDGLVKKGKEKKKKKKKEKNDGTKEDTVKGKTNEKKEKKEKKTKKNEKEAGPGIAETEGGKGEESCGTSNTPRQLLCLFGFVSSWLTRRKAKRRDKKRKAIAARSSSEHLVDHRTTKGGESFTIEVNNRPSLGRKPSSPPINQTPGPIHREVHENASKRRAEHLKNKMDSLRSYEKKLAKCTRKRLEQEVEFQMQAGLKIRQKQRTAQKNRDTLRRCKSRLAKVPLNHPEIQSICHHCSIYGPFFQERIVDKNVDSLEL